MHHVSSSLKGWYINSKENVLFDFFRNVNNVTSECAFTISISGCLLRFNWVGGFLYCSYADVLLKHLHLKQRTMKVSNTTVFFVCRRYHTVITRKYTLQQQHWSPVQCNIQQAVPYKMQTQIQKYKIWIVMHFSFTASVETILSKIRGTNVGSLKDLDTSMFFY